MEEELELTYPGNDVQCWMPGCSEARIQPPPEAPGRSWKVCLHHFAQHVRELHEALGWV